MAYSKGAGCGRGRHSFVERNGYMQCTKCGSTRTVAIYGRHPRHHRHHKRR